MRLRTVTYRAAAAGSDRMPCPAGFQSGWPCRSGSLCFPAAADGSPDAASVIGGRSVSSFPPSAAGHGQAVLVVGQIDPDGVPVPDLAAEQSAGESVPDRRLDQPT